MSSSQGVSFQLHQRGHLSDEKSQFGIAVGAYHWEESRENPNLFKTWSQVQASGTSQIKRQKFWIRRAMSQTIRLMLMDPVFLRTPPGAGGRNVWRMKRKFELKCVRYGYDKFQSQVSMEGGNIAPNTNDEFDSDENADAHIWRSRSQWWIRQWLYILEPAPGSFSSPLTPPPSPQSGVFICH